MRSEFSAFVKKEFAHIFRDMRTVMLSIITPILLIFLFSFAISTEIRNINVAIVMQDDDILIRKLGNSIDASQYFNLVDYLSSPDEIAPLMRSGKIDIALAFSDDFDSNLISADGCQIDIIADASNPNIAASETMYMSGIISEWMGSIGGSYETGQGRLVSNVRMLYNPQLLSSYNFVPGILGLVLMLICALMTSVSIAREKETGTLEVLLVSPVKAPTIILAKMIPYLVMGIIDFVVIILMSKFVLGLPMSGSLFWIVISSLVYIILGLSIGLMVSTVVKTQVVASLSVAIVFLFPMLMLSGMLFPIESMPKIFQYISMVIPARWYMTIMRNLMIQGTSFIYLTKEFLILIIMTIVVMSVSLFKFNDKLE